ITPVVFEPGTSRLGPEMEAHLEKVAGFLRATPAIGITLAAIFTQADLDAVKGHLAASPPPAPPATSEPAPGGATPREGSRPLDPTREALRVLGTQRLDVVRQALMRGGGVDARRLAGTVPRSSLVEATGASRVEFALKPLASSE